MPTFTTEVFDEQLGHSFESRIEGTNDEKGTQRLEVKVPHGSPLLMLTVSSLDPYNSKLGPSNVSVSIRPPANADVQPQQVVSEDGKIIYALENPPEGTWTVIVEYQPNASARLNVAAYGKRFWERLKELPRNAACKSCHVFLKVAVDAAITALVFHTLPVGAAVTVVESALRGLFGKGLIEALFDKVMEILLGYADNPLDRIVHRICALAGACPAEG